MDAIIFLDIRNFSAHREYLARSKAGRPLSDLVKTLLEEASSLAKSLVDTHGGKKVPLLNHTGDGFVLVLRDRRSSVAAVTFASIFRETTEHILRNYQKTVWETRMAEKYEMPKPLGYGMGLHCGDVTSFKYRGITGVHRVFLGSAVNVASRVEGCTKDHPHAVLCTKKVLDFAKKEFGKAMPPGFDGYFGSLGLHNLRGLKNPTELFRCEPGLHSFLRNN